MWKPAEVLPQHKRRAVTLFVALILGIAAYSAYLVYKAVEKSKNPSTSFVQSNKLYKYPDIYVCFYNFFGCDDIELEEQCMSTAYSTEGGNTTAVFNPGGEREQEIATRAFLTENRGWCVSFDVSEVDISNRQRDPEDYILLDMYWYPGGSANASTTCMAGDGGWSSHSESVFMFLRDSDTGILSAGTQVSYSCMTSESSSHVFTFMGIGLTKVNRIRHPNTATYKALATSSHVYKDERNANITGIVHPYAWLSLEVAQLTDSLEEITEVDPLELAELFGNIGGFWDLLLLLWPIFFVAASRQDPHLKVRNFRKSVTKPASSVRVRHPLRRKNRLGPGEGRNGFMDDEGEEQAPAWETRESSLEYSRQNASFGRFSRGLLTDTLTHSSRRQRAAPLAAAAATTTAAAAPPMPSSSARPRRLGATASAHPCQQHTAPVGSSDSRAVRPGRAHHPTGAVARNPSAPSRHAIGDGSSRDLPPGAFVV